VAAADEKVRERMRLCRRRLPRTELLRRNKAPHCSGRKGALSSNSFHLIHTPPPLPGNRHKKMFHQEEFVGIKGYSQNCIWEKGKGVVQARGRRRQFTPVRALI